MVWGMRRVQRQADVQGHLEPRAQLRVLSNWRHRSLSDRSMFSNCSRYAMACVAKIGSIANDRSSSWSAMSGDAGRGCARRVGEAVLVRR